MLSWSCSDPDEDPLTYDVYFGTVDPPDTMVSSNQTGRTFGMGERAEGTTYYWKVVARDVHADTTASPVWSFTTGGIGGSPCPGRPTVVYAGKTYNTVQIGSQCWLRENLDIGSIIPGSLSQGDNGTIEKHCYNDNPANCNTYGGLYQWDEAVQYDTTQGVQGICPPGWHIPTFTEFQTLRSAVGGNGNALKRQDQGSGGGQGTNTSGFSALLAGYGDRNGYFLGLRNDGFFWSSTQYAATYARDLYLNGYDVNVGLFRMFKTGGFSVRCLHD